MWLVRATRPNRTWAGIFKTDHYPAQACRLPFHLRAVPRRVALTTCLAVAKFACKGQTALARMPLGPAHQRGGVSGCRVSSVPMVSGLVEQEPFRHPPLTMAAPPDDSQRC